MSKKYEKPKLIFQEIHCETLLCSCAVQDPTLNEALQCGYFEEDMGFKIFAANWLDCATDKSTDIYCYHNGVLNLFGS